MMLDLLPKVFPMSTLTIEVELCKQHGGYHLRFAASAHLTTPVGNFSPILVVNDAIPGIADDHDRYSCQRIGDEVEVLLKQPLDAGEVQRILTECEGSMEGYQGNTTVYCNGLSVRQPFREFPQIYTLALSSWNHKGSIKSFLRQTGARPQPHCFMPMERGKRRGQVAVIPRALRQSEIVEIARAYRGWLKSYDESLFWWGRTPDEFLSDIN